MCVCANAIIYLPYINTHHVLLFTFHAFVGYSLLQKPKCRAQTFLLCAILQFVILHINMTKQKIAPF